MYKDLISKAKFDVGTRIIDATSYSKCFKTNSKQAGNGRQNKRQKEIKNINKAVHRTNDN